MEMSSPGLKHERALQGRRASLAEWKNMSKFDHFGLELRQTP